MNDEENTDPNRCDGHHWLFLEDGVWICENCGGVRSGFPRPDLFDCTLDGLICETEGYGHRWAEHDKDKQQCEYCGNERAKP